MDGAVSEMRNELKAKELQELTTLATCGSDVADAVFPPQFSWPLGLMNTPVMLSINSRPTSVGDYSAEPNRRQRIPGYRFRKTRRQCEEFDYDAGPN